MAPKTKRSDSTFTKEQEIVIIQLYAQFKSPTAVKIQFIAKYRKTLNLNWLKKLQPSQFRKVQKRFLDNGISKASHSQHVHGDSRLLY